MSNEGKMVRVHYVGTFDDGEVFDSSRDRNEPLTFKCMANQMIEGFDKAVNDMNVGDVVDIRLAPAEAYGERQEDMVQQVPVAQIPNGDQLPVGHVIYMQDGDDMFPVKVVSVEDGMATFDLNHPMAGKTLNFNIELLEILEPGKPATEL